MTGSRWTLLTSTGLVLLSPFKERVIMLVSPACSYVFWKSLRSSWIDVEVIYYQKYWRVVSLVCVNFLPYVQIGFVVQLRDQSVFWS